MVSAKGNAHRATTPDALPAHPHPATDIPAQERPNGPLLGLLPRTTRRVAQRGRRRP
jgi:hypothetical protein